MSVIYTVPKVCNTAKYWYIHFRYNGKQFRFKFHLNKIEDLKERAVEFDAYRKILHDKLKNDWNPNISDVASSRAGMYIVDALRFALEKKKTKISKKTHSEYNGSINFFETSIKTLGLENLKICDTKRVHVKLIIEQTKELRNWSNKAYNKHLNHLKAILSELIQWDVLEFNPAFNVKNLPVVEADANNPASDSDVNRIKNELENNHFYFWVFAVTIFHTGIRPEEILKITLGMVDLKNSEIVLPAEITKTNKKRVVPINPFLLEYYLKLNFESLPKNYYLFGSFREEGRGNVGKYVDFIPAPTKLKRDTATKRWFKLVKSEKGLNINMNLYAMKHLGANKKILAGLELDSLRELYGHSSKLMTEKYAKVIKEVHRQQILERSPDL